MNRSVVLWAVAVACVACGGGGEGTTNKGGTASGGTTSAGEGGGGAGDGGASSGGASSGGASSGGASASGGASSGGSGGTAGGGGGIASGGSSSGGNGQGGAGGGSGGAGGAGGGSGGAPACNDGDTQPCFTGDPATIGIGVCVEGLQTCSGGMFGPCVGEVVASAEACNGQDDDCNGNIDELGQQTCGLGACEVTVDVCVNGMPQACVPLPPAPSEACDGVDDDCDGSIDEGCSCIDGSQQPCYSGPNGTQGIGACTGGTQTCSNGAWGACVGEVVPSAETCNAIDDNCNAAVDEGLGNTTCGVGQCQAIVQNCVNGQVQQCQPGQPVAETCNGQDDDCDGTADDSIPQQTCGLGPCQVTAPGCVNGQVPPCVPNLPSGESCDNVDNDCDGVVDDGNPGGGSNCSTGSLGVCAAGTTTCSNGGIVCTPNAMPSAETCNALDDDCDGTTDENNPGGGAMCNTGLLGVCAAGTVTCQNGSLSCVSNVQSSAETCNNLDDDCDGVVDDGNPGGGGSCFTGLLGVCSAGTLQCTGGAITCVQTMMSSNETCNGLDDDCDGAIDDGNPGGGGSCNTGLLGECSAGTVTCINSALTCAQNNSPVPEVCANAKDDNCNGQTDESLDIDGDGWGTCTGDCCDSAGPCSSTPALVNPGAFEVLNNMINDDCDAATSDTVAPPDCASVADFSAVTAAQVAQAMDICQFTTANPPLPQKKWGVITSQQLLPNGGAAGGQLSNMQNWQTAVLQNYGTGGIVPKKGPTMAGISSGRMRDANDPGFVAPNNGIDFLSASQPPAAYLAAHGGALPASAGCSGNCPAGSGANDGINIRLTIRVPTNAQSFSYNFRYFSSEYWTWQCTVYNDFYLALLQTGAPGIPADKNISFDNLNNPVSVNNGFFDICQVKGCNTCPLGFGQLTGTGMELDDPFAGGGLQRTGGGTQWLLTTAPIVPGETMQIEFMVFDVSDGILDSLALLDNFTWALTPASVGTVTD